MTHPVPRVLGVDTPPHPPEAGKSLQGGAGGGSKVI